MASANANANIIIPRIWLGNRKAAQNIEFHNSNGITTIFNCTKDIPFYNTALRQYRVPLDDNLDPAEIRNLSLWAMEVAYKMMREYREGNTILVHCAAGMQRSAAVVAIFLMAFYRCRAKEAMEYVKSKRQVAFYIRANFGPSIEDWDSVLHREVLPKTGQLPGHILVT